MAGTAVLDVLEAHRWNLGGPSAGSEGLTSPCSLGDETSDDCTGSHHQYHDDQPHINAFQLGYDALQSIEDTLLKRLTSVPSR